VDLGMGAANLAGFGNLVEPPHVPPAQMKADTRVRQFDRQRGANAR